MRGNDAQIVYNCRGCRFKDCRREWKVKVCYVCYGNDKYCEKCNGSNEIAVDKCPRHLQTIEASHLLPFYFSWVRGAMNVWPDGAGRLFQPVKLRQSFEVLHSFYNRKKKEEDDAE